MPRSAAFCGRCGYDLRTPLSPRRPPPPLRKSSGGGFGAVVLGVIAVVAALVFIGFLRSTAGPAPHLNFNPPIQQFRPPAVPRYPNAFTNPTPLPQPGIIHVPSTANRIVFVCDASENMARPFNQIKTELKRTIQSLAPYQQFNLIFYQGGEAVGVYQTPSLVTSEAKSRAFGLIDRMRPRQGSDPRVALEQAFAEEPDQIYLITDGNFTETNVDAVLAVCRQKNGDPTHRPARIDPVVVLDNTGWRPIENLRQIARENAGTPLFFPSGR